MQSVTRIPAVTPNFDIAVGSIPGREHLRLQRNNQDAYAWAETPQGTIAVVCDGCGSHPHSEVGAKIGAQLLVKIISQQLGHQSPSQASDFWESIRQEVLKQLHDFVAAIRGDFSQVVQDYFLFTILGAVITPEDTWIFGLGDGVYAVNDQVQAIAPFAHNAPPYLAYGLIEAAVSDWFDPADLSLQVHQYIPTFQLESLLLGTDGVTDLLQAEASILANQNRPQISLAQFAQDDRYFRNPDYLRRQLSRLNRELVQPDWETKQLQRQMGLLPDDTTILMVRRQIITR